MLRPSDIQNKEFEKKIKGYNPDQVDDFLDKIIHDYDLLIKENKNLREKLEAANAELERFKTIEKTLDNALITARESAAGIISNANIESENIIRRAKLNAQALEKQIDAEHLKKQQQIAALDNEIDSYKIKIKSMCASIIEISSHL